MRSHVAFSGNKAVQPYFASGKPESEQPRQQRSLGKRLLMPMLAAGALIATALGLSELLSETHCERAARLMPDARVTCNEHGGGIIDITPEEFRSPD